MTIKYQNIYQLGPGRIKIKVKSLVRYLEDELYLPDFPLIRIKEEHLTADDKIPPPNAQLIIEGWQKGKY